MKKKVMTGIELVGAGALLTGGSVLMERLTDNDIPPISGRTSFTTRTTHHQS